MNPSDVAASDDLDGLLDALDEADGALRALYRQLAENPDLAGQHEPQLRELHAKRLDLAQRVGLATLARQRLSRVAQSEELPAAVQSSGTEAASNGVIPTTPAEHVPAAEEDRTPPSAPPAPPASSAQLAEWKSAVRSAGLGGGLRTTLSPATAWPLVLHELMETVGPPRDQDTSVATIEEMDALDEVATGERQGQWVRLPKHVQQLWLSMLVARTRVLKESPSWAESKDRLKAIIGRYPPWAKAHTPGHVNGMQLKHEPLHGSWGQDVRHYWDALADLLGEERIVRPTPTARKKAKPHDAIADDEPDIDPRWPVLPRVRGRKAIVLGGDPREPNRLRLEHAFQLASLEWPAIEGPRKVDAAVERIRNGAYDLVLVLTPFVFHAQSEPLVEAAKSASVPWALVDGYGIAAVKLGLERFLGGPRGGITPRG